MAITSKNWSYWSSGWTDGGSSTPNSQHAAIGPSDGNSRYRTCVAITLGSLGATEKRSKLKFKLALHVSGSYGSNVANEDELTVCCTDSGPIKSTHIIQGDVIATKTVAMDFPSTYFNVEFSIDISDLGKEAQTIYVYLTSQDVSTGNYHIFKFQSSGTTITETTTSDTASVITNGISTAGGNIYKSTDTIAFNWIKGSDSTNNTVTGYTAYLQFGSAPTTSYYNDYTSVGKDTLQASFSFSDATRGTEVHVGIRALGQAGDGEIVTKLLGTINYLPTAPTFTSSGDVLNTSNKITYTITQGSDLNSIQTISLAYSLNNGPKVICTSPFELTSKTENLKTGSNSIVFYTYDGLEYSEPSNSHSFTATFAPVIEKVTMKHNTVQDAVDAVSSLASEAEISFVLSSGSAETVELYVRSGSSTSLTGEGTTVPKSLYTYNKSNYTIKIPNTCAISSITAGHYYQFAFKVGDGSVMSDRTQWQSTKRKPYAPLIPTYRGYNNYQKSSAVAFSNYYMKNVALEFEGLKLTSGYAKMKSISIIALYDNGPKEYSFGTDTNSAGKYYLKMDLSPVNPNLSTKFKIKVVDEANQVSEYEIPNLTLIKSSNLTFGGNIVDVNPKSLKPLSNSSPFKIVHPIASASGTKVVTYTYKITVGSKSKNLIASEYTEGSPSGIDEIAIEIPAATINKIAKELATSTNDIFSSSVSVTAEDGFKDTEAKTLSSTNFSINFSESPSFVNPSLDFRIKHEYYTNPPSLSITSGIEVTASSELKVRMVNSGEGIIFMLPKATDLNGNDDIKEYQIDVCRRDYTGQNATPGTFYPLIKIPYETLRNGIQDADYFYYRYTASTYTKTEYFYFQVYVIDQAGNSSSKKKTATYIIGSRTVSPIFSVNNIDVTRNNDQVTLKYKFKITDLGGNAKKTGWDEYFYNNYPNFEREINGYSPQALLIVEIAPDQNFKDNVVSDQIDFSPSGTQKLYDFTSDEIELNGFDKSHVKIFIRFTLQVSHGLKNANKEIAIVSSQQVFTYFGAIPTVAHRKHKVGINTTVLGDDDVLVIENYQGTKYIVLKGTDKDNAANSYEIRIDLLQGKISGKKTQGQYSEDYLIIDGATIDGGEW